MTADLIAHGNGVRFITITRSKPIENGDFAQITVVARVAKNVHGVRLCGGDVYINGKHKARLRLTSPTRASVRVKMTLAEETDMGVVATGKRTHP